MFIHNICFPYYVAVNIDLPEKLTRKTKSKKNRENKRKLGNSIEQRPDIVDTREEFGHWEIDSVIGRKVEGESQVMTIVERKLRESIWIKVRDHSAEAIDEALSALIDQFGDKYNEVFRSITGDNGSEFANLSQVESKGITVYFTHPYSSYEKGTNECHKLFVFVNENLFLVGVFQNLYQPILLINCLINPIHSISP